MQEKDNTQNNEQEHAYEFNSYTSNAGYINSSDTSCQNFLNSLYQCGLYDVFDKYTIEMVLNNPISNHEEAKRISNYIYTRDGIVANAIDYMTAMPCLDRVIISKGKKTKRAKNKIKRNKELMSKALDTIQDKLFIRDALQTEMLNGIFFYYFDVSKRVVDREKYLSDSDVLNIWEINSADELQINIITLPYSYTRIIGKRNGRYSLAFNLLYFNTLTEYERKNKLKIYPKEIRDAYEKYQKNEIGKTWVKLDNNHTLCRKIKCKDSEPWGRPLAIAALNDILYRDSFVDTKRHVLDEINNKVFYETYPEGALKGTCALTQKQQEQQHGTVRDAILQKNSRGGVSFFSVAAGTKINSIDVSTDIFDDRNESDLNNQISLDMGICSTLLGATSTGANYAVQQSNLELITAQLYRWVYEIQEELNWVINKNIIKDDNNPVEIYYFPTSFVNRSKFFDQMKTLYTEASGSLTFLIAASGVDPDSYLSVLDEEIENGLFEKYKPHQTSHTLSAKDSAEIGRPAKEDATNPNTVQSQMTNSNGTPKPSTDS